MDFVAVRGDERLYVDDEIAKCYPLDDTDDQITVIDGPDYSWHDHVSPIFIMPLRYPLSKKLRTRYETYFKNLIADH